MHVRMKEGEILRDVNRVQFILQYAVNHIGIVYIQNWKITTNTRNLESMHQVLW